MRVKGDSMIDAGVLDGDLVVVEKRAGARRGESSSGSSITSYPQAPRSRTGRFILRPENKADPVIRPGRHAGNIRRHGGTGAQGRLTGVRSRLEVVLRGR